MSIAPAPVRRGRALGRLQLALTALAVLLLAAILVDRVFFDTEGGPAGTGSGVASTQARTVPAFAAVDLDGANNVVVRAGAKQSVVVHADSNLLGRVTTRVRSGRLTIGTTPGNLNAKSPMYVAVTVPSIEALTLRGAGNIDVSEVDARRLIIKLPGSGVIRATGTTSRLEVTLGGSGTALLGQLIARDAKAGLSGNGTITLTATDRLDASVSGSGTILYGGNPAHLTTAVTGSGAITAG